MLNISSNIDARIKEREDKQFVMGYKAELDESMRPKRTYEDNSYKSYTLLWERYAKEINFCFHQDRTTIVW